MIPGALLQCCVERAQRRRRRVSNLPGRLEWNQLDKSCGTTAPQNRSFLFPARLVASSLLNRRRSDCARRMSACSSDMLNELSKGIEYNVAIYYDAEQDACAYTGIVKELGTCMIGNTVEELMQQAGHNIQIVVGNWVKEGMPLQRPLSKAEAAQATAEVMGRAPYRVESVTVHFPPSDVANWLRSACSQAPEASECPVAASVAS